MRISDWSSDVCSSDLEAVILRPSVVFGPEDGLFNRFAEMARFSPALPLIGGRRTRFQPVYVGDVAAAIMTALSELASRGKAHELRGPHVYSFREFMQLPPDNITRKPKLVYRPFGLPRLQESLKA